MKLAISGTGKGGAGKSTPAAEIILLMARRGRKILAVDANPMIYFVVSKTS
jgi:CO dehydrogenase nickel-insertion accessory protein CooC1